MKKVLFFILISSSSLLNAQVKISEPEYSGNIVYVNDSVGSGIKLEQQTASVITKANGASYVPVVGLFAGKATSKYVVQGSSSPIKIDKKTNLKFIVKVSDNSVDPSTVIYVFKLNPEKGIRTIEIASANMVGDSKSGDIKYLTFKSKKYGQSSYLIELDNIESGEYAITLASRRDIFNMFSIK